MAGYTRRIAVAASAGAVVTGMAGLAAAVAQPTGEIRGKDSDGTVSRYEPTPSAPGVPLISGAVAHGGVVYLSGVTSEPGAADDIAGQTRHALARIDGLLAKAGTDKSRLLAVHVWLTDMEHYHGFNEAWNAWVDPKNPPARVCVTTPRLWNPTLLVEIMATAAA